MKILVIDVAAEKGGAKTVLEQYIYEAKNNLSCEYCFVLSTLCYEKTDNVKFISIPWVKKNWVYRIWFDIFYVRKIIRKEEPNLILSLQNKAVISCGIPQEVYFHNALFISDKKYSFRESRTIWVYQRLLAPIIKRSLNKASKIYVQAEWIKQSISNKWKIDGGKVYVKPPLVDFSFNRVERQDKVKCQLFYPANFEIYKNHITLLKACDVIGEEYGKDCGLRLVLTGNFSDLNEECKKILSRERFPVAFCGTLSKQDMREMYLQSILVFPSLIETVGLPLIEAAACNCKIIASDLPYAHEALENYPNVSFFDSENAEDLIKLIRKIIIE